MWPFNLMKKIKDLEKLNKHMQEANRHLFDMYKRERFEMDAHTQDCIEAYCQDAGINYTAIKTPQEYYEWIWHELTFLELIKGFKEYEKFIAQSNPNTGIYRPEGDSLEFRKTDSGDN